MDATDNIFSKVIRAKHLFFVFLHLHSPTPLHFHALQQQKSSALGVAVVSTVDEKSYR